VAAVADHKQIWQTGGWVEKFALPFDEDATGYGQSAIDVGAVRPASVDLLIGYYDEVHAQTLGYVEQLTDRDLEKVVDDSFDPPVTLGARLISVIVDDLQHVGQAGYIRGLVTRN
jgi:hypothetical protein